MEAGEVGTISKEERESERFRRFVFAEGVSTYSLCRATMKSSTKISRRKTQREAAREKRQRDPVSDGEVEETEIVFRSSESPTDPPSPVPGSTPGSPSASADLQYEDVLDMVQKLHEELGMITLDNDKIRSVCNQLLRDNQTQDRAIGDLTGEVWIVRQDSDLDRMLRQNIPSSSRTSFTMRGISARTTNIKIT